MRDIDQAFDLRRRRVNFQTSAFGPLDVISTQGLDKQAGSVPEETSTEDSDKPQSSFLSLTFADTMGLLAETNQQDVLEPPLLTDNLQLPESIQTVPHVEADRIALYSVSWPRNEKESTSSRRQRHHSRTPFNSKTPHTIIERRYRENLNNQFHLLRNKLPGFADPCPGTTDIEDAGHRAPSKAKIISAAAKYIKDLEAEKTQILAGNKALKNQVANLRELVRCGDCAIYPCLATVVFDGSESAGPEP